MLTVREHVHALMRAWGLTTVFGNPGSNELPFLDQFPDDFRYVLGLHEGSALAMADAYAQVTGRAALVNLHAAAGLGNAMGNLTNAAQQHTPLVVTVGQQARGMVGLNAMLSEARMTEVGAPHVKGAFEPRRAQDVPRTLAEAYHLAMLPPRGPVLVSLPLDDWREPVEGREVEHLAARQVTAAGQPSEEQVDDLVRRLSAARSPALVLGPEADSEPAFAAAVALAEKAGLPVWIAPSPPRCPFPTTHPHYQGVLPNSVEGVTTTLDGRDFVLVVGAPVFRYHVNLPAPYLPPGAELVSVTTDPAAAARAPMGDTLVADPAAVLTRLAARADAPAERPAVTPRPTPAAVTSGAPPFPVEAVLDTLIERLTPDTLLVQESTANTAQFWERMPIERAGGLLFPAAGGLGFGLPAAVGAALAAPGRPVVAILGDGATQYGVQGLWTAAQHNLSVTFVVLRNNEYGALRWFTGPLGVSKVPGLDLPGIDAVPIAAGYGVPGEQVTDLAQLTAPHQGPRLFQVPIIAA